jgi:hypothetical protein
MFPNKDKIEKYPLFLKSLEPFYYPRMDKKGPKKQFK